MTDNLHGLVVAAYATRWVLALIGLILAGCYVAVIVGDRNTAEREAAQLRAENAALRRRLRIRSTTGTGLGHVVALPVRREVRRG